MPSWNKRFFVPSLLLACIVLSGAVLGQPQAQIDTTESSNPVFLPQNDERVAAVEVSAQIEVKTEDVEPVAQVQEAENSGQIAPSSAQAETTQQTPTVASQTPPIPATSAPQEEEVEEITPKTISVKLTIQGPGISKSGKISVEAGSTVYQVLKKGSNQLDFSLKTAQHNSLGIFVEGIAGVTNNPKANVYWLYYVNGQFASRGVSLQTVQEGDTITWSYE